MDEVSQFKYWVFWISDGFGLHLGNTLGIYIGDSQIEQLSDFARYPLIAGHATYLVALAHVTTLICMIWHAQACTLGLELSKSRMARLRPRPRGLRQ